MDAKAAKNLSLLGAAIRSFCAGMRLSLVYISLELYASWTFSSSLGPFRSHSTKEESVVNGSTDKRDDADKTASAILRHKVASGIFDVFLCHNHQDKPRIKSIGEDLKAQGVLPWLDEWQLRPGLPWQRALEQQIENVQSAAVFVGAEGIGPWQHQELDAFLREFVDRGRPVIPVVLPDAPDIPDLPIFLKGMTWVDFRASDPDPMEQLLWGITGEHEGASAGSLLPKRPVSPPLEAGSTPTNLPTFPSSPSVNLAQLLVEQTGWPAVPGLMIAVVGIAVLPLLLGLRETAPNRIG